MAELQAVAQTSPMPRKKQIWCERLPEESLPTICSELIHSFIRIPVEKRFSKRQNAEHLKIPGDGFQRWKCWSTLHLHESFLEIFPTGMTFSVHRIMLQGGAETWLRWLDSFPNDWEITVLLWYCGDKAGTFIGPLERACMGEEFSRLRPLLLFSLITDRDTDDFALSHSIRENAAALLRPCAEVMADYAFLLCNPQRAKTWEAIADACANETGIALVKDGADNNQGKLAALATLLCRSNAATDHLHQYRDAYLHWVRETTLSGLQQNPKGGYTEYELSFLTHTADILSGFDDAVNELEQLWPRKTARYYGWAGDRNYKGNAWFQHIGLVLWRIGHIRFEKSGSDELLCTVLDTMNRYLPDAINETAYDLLLLNLLCDTGANIARIKALRIALIRKVISIPLLLTAIPHHMGAEEPDREVLSALRDRLALLLRFPQKGVHADAVVRAAKEQLQRLEEQLLYMGDTIKGSVSDTL